MKTKETQESYRILARKYRPRDFSDLIGQDSMVLTLSNAFAAGRIAQAWMLTGMRGVGKTTTARILARALNYKTAMIDQPTTELSSFGDHCQAIIEGRHVDVVEMDAASHTGVDDVREIIEQARYRPVLARYKVYIIDEVHMLSMQAFNALLKTLEEPPPHVKFIFATTEIRKVPVTVLSRCQRFDLRRIRFDILTDYLQKITQIEAVIAEREALSMIARASDGSVRDALSILDQAISWPADQLDSKMVQNMLGLADHNQLIDLFDYSMQGDIQSALALFRDLYDKGADPMAMITALAEFNHLVTRLRITPEFSENLALEQGERERGLQLAKKLSIQVLSRCWQMLLKGMTEIENATKPVLAAEMLLIRLAYAANLPTVEEALKSLESLPKDSPPKELLPKQTLPKEAQPREIQSREELPKGKSVEQDPPIAETFVQDHNIQDHNIQDHNIHDHHDKKNRDEKNTVASAKPTGISLDRFEDLIKLAEQKGELQIKFMLREQMRLVSFQHGLIEFVPTAGALPQLSTQLTKLLYQWTGERWVVTMKEQLPNDSKQQTVAEKEIAEKAALLSNIIENDHVAAEVLAHFPGSEIIDVRTAESDEGIFQEKTDFFANEFIEEAEDEFSNS